jgi:hypothetical protein
MESNLLSSKTIATLDLSSTSSPHSLVLLSIHRWYVYWRLFFIGCAEFFGARGGEEYIVSHYLFTKPK